MPAPEIPNLTFSEIFALAGSASLDGCEGCAALKCPGWEAMPASFDQDLLERIGRIGSGEGEPEPTLTEYHPDGTRYWSEIAPIAIDYFPYNRCEVCVCKHCRKPFFRYTEYGGYYVEARIRMIDVKLLVLGADWSKSLQQLQSFDRLMSAWLDKKLHGLRAAPCMNA